MKLSAIRGATTIDEDSEEQVRLRALELYDRIAEANKLNAGDIIYIHITTTADITAYYPATALRKNGCSAPLFSSQEPQIKGSLPLCVRFLILAKIKKPIHIYLRGAQNLREDNK